MRPLYIVTFITALLSPLSLSADCVKAWQANLRKGPSSQYKKSWVVGQYMPLLRIKKNGAWVQVKDMDGEKHWAHQSLLTRQISCVVVKSDFAYLRKGPSNKAAKHEMGLAEKYTSFKKVDERTHWVQVEDSNKRRFWVYRKNLWEAKRTSKINL